MMHTWGMRPSPGAHEAIGATLLYKLRPDQLPVNPEKICQGRIEKIFVDIHDRSQLRYYLVTSLDHDEGEPDLVYPEQVVRFS